MKYYSIGEFAKQIGKTIQTLRNWDKKDILKPSHVTKGGTRYYSQEQLNHFLGLKSEKQINKKIIGYCRVSSHKQKDDLEKRLRRLQRQVSKKYEKNKKGKEFVKTKNILKLEEKIQQTHRKLANIRNNYLHQTTTSIVKTKPYRIVIKDLNASINLASY